MFTHIKGVYGALGVMLALIAIYLFLANAGGATQIIGSGASATTSIFRVLQGRG